MLATKTYKYITTGVELDKICLRLHDYLKSNPKAKLAVDIESQNSPGYEGVPRPLIDPVTGKSTGRIRLIQIGLDPAISDEQFVIDVLELSNRGVRIRDIGQSLKLILESATIIGQNIKYDYQFLRVILGIDMKKMRDCMLISQVLYAGDKIKHGLSRLYSEYLHFGWFKEFTGMTFDEYDSFKKEHQTADWSGKLSEDDIRYAADDVRLIFYLYKAQMERLDEFVEKYERKNKRGQTILNPILLECDLIPTYAMMELRGVKFDIEYHRQTIKFLADERDKAEKEVGKHFSKQVKKTNGLRGKQKQIWFIDEPINIGSWQQIKEALKPYLPEEWYLGRGGTDEETLIKFKDKHQALPEIIKYKQANSKLNKYGQNLIDYCDSQGIIHPSWFQVGGDEASIDTGRSSCKNPPLQTIPQKEDDIFGRTAAELFRRPFIARSGHVLIDADYSQIEPRLTAEVCGEESQILEFQRSREVDTHAMTARAAFNLAELPAKNSFERKAGKEMNLGLGYGMGYKKCARRITEATGEFCSDDRAKQLIEIYYSNIPKIKLVKQEIERAVRQGPDQFESLAPYKDRRPIIVLFNEFGRARRWCLKPNHEELARKSPEKLSKYFKGDDLYPIPPFRERLSEAAREGFNAKIQSLAADIMKKALLAVDRELNQLPLDIWSEGIIMVVHDEMVVEVRESLVDQAKEIIERCMLEAGREFLKVVPCFVDLGVATNWADSH